MTGLQDLNKTESNGILGYERKESILRMLEETGKVTVANLARHFSVSMETIRRDLQQLYLENRLIKVHGGALAMRGRTYEAPFQDRITLNKEEKSRSTSRMVGKAGGAGAGVDRRG